MSNFEWLEKTSFDYVMELIKRWKKECVNNDDSIMLEKMKNKIEEHPQLANTLVPYLKNERESYAFLKAFLGK
jgi:hypothetical protein